MKIRQQTPEWLEIKKNYVGASEIYSLAHYYCRQDLEKIGVNLIKEKPFKSALEIFLKIKHKVTVDSIDPVNSEFGLKMEGYVLSALKENSPKGLNLASINGLSLSSSAINYIGSGAINYIGSKDFVINENIHSLSACSPDGYTTIINKDATLWDFDNLNQIDYSFNEGVLELKTGRFEDSIYEEIGLRWQYIFQLQYQMLVCDKSWGILAMITAKEKELDTDFQKGKSVMMMDTRSLDEIYDLYSFVYVKSSIIESIILKALNLFQADLDNDKYPSISEDAATREREKKALGLAFPDHYGTLIADEIIDDLMIQRMQAATEIKKIEYEKDLVQNAIFHSVNKYSQIIGKSTKLIFDKNGAMRFYNLNQ